MKSDNEVNKKFLGYGFINRRGVFMFIRKLLVLGVLTIYPTYGTMTSDDFVGGCRRLVDSIREKTQIDNKESFVNRGNDLNNKLDGAVCNDCVVDYSSQIDENTLISNLVQAKFEELKLTATQFFIDLRTALQHRKSFKTRGLFWSWKGENRREVNDLEAILTDLEKLNSFLSGTRLRTVVEALFLTARNGGRLRGSEELQEWFRFYRRNITNGPFSVYLMSPFNTQALELGPKMFLSATLDTDTQRRVNEWRTQFQAMKEINFPTIRLTNSLLEENQLAPFLEGINETYQPRVIKQWMDSLRGISRFKLFLPVISVDNVERFFFHSGGTSYTKSVRSLLQCRDLDSLEETLWGAPVKSANTPKGLILNALLSKTNTLNPRSYKNAALIIADLEDLLTADTDHREYVVKIWDFLKFVTSEEFETGGDDGLYRFPYLGIENRDTQGVTIDVSELNVVLCTPKKKLYEICGGVSGIVGGWSAMALPRRMSLIVKTGESNSSDDDSEGVYNELLMTAPTSRQNSRRASMIESEQSND